MHFVTFQTFVQLY